MWREQLELWIRTGRALQSIRVAFSRDAYSAVMKAVAGHKADGGFFSQLTAAAGQELFAYTGYIDNKDVRTCRRLRCCPWDVWVFGGLAPYHRVWCVVSSSSVAPDYRVADVMICGVS